MRSSIARLCRAAGISILAGAALACTHKQLPDVKVPEIPRPIVKRDAPPPVDHSDWLPANVIAKLADENAPFYFARRTDGGLALYASGGRWFTNALDAAGAPVGAATDIGPSVDAPSMALRAVGDGYLAVWLEPVAQNASVKLLALDTKGKPQGAPTLVTQIADEVNWVDVLPNARGAIVLWQLPHDERFDLAAAPVTGSKIEGAPIVVAHDVVGWGAVATERGAVIATVSVPEAPPAAPSKPERGRKKVKIDVVSTEGGGEKLGRVSLVELDAKAKPSPPVLVSPEASALPDIDVAEVAGRYVLVWTDERAIDAAVYIAAVDPGGKVVVTPKRATAPFGEQALVSLVAEEYAPGGAKSRRALLAWEDQIKMSREGRLIHLATIGPDGSVGKERGTLTFSANGPPDLVPDGEGFAAVTLAAGVAADAPASGARTAEPDADAKAGGTGIGPAPPREAPGAAPPPNGGDPGVWPWFVRFGADLTVSSSAPIRAQPFPATATLIEGAPYLTHFLECSGGTCTTLAVGSGAGASLATVTLPIGRKAARAPARRDTDDAPPRASAMNAIYDGDRLSKIAAVELPGTKSMLAAWVTYFLESSGGGEPEERGKDRKKGRPHRNEDAPSATLAVRPIGADGVPGKPVTISHKALSIGGIAMAAALGEDARSEDKHGDAKKPETAIAWVEREKGEPQVVVTKVGPDGTKTAQKAVTTVSRKRKQTEVPSEVSDVAIAADPSGGWYVAWTDTRDGNAEIYVAKLDASLNKVGAEKRITDAPGDSVEVALVARGKDVLLAWADARNKPDEGTADIYVARLDGSSLRKLAPETRVFASALHSRSPQLVAAGSGVELAWIEDETGAKIENAAAERGIRIAQLDGNGGVIGVPQLVRAEGPVTATALACGLRIGCRGVLTTQIGDNLMLEAFQLQPGAPATSPKAIAALTGPSMEEVLPVFSSAGAGSLFLADDSVNGSARLRLMSVAWP